MSGGGGLVVGGGGDVHLLLPAYSYTLCKQSLRTIIVSQVMYESEEVSQL